MLGLFVKNHALAAVHGGYQVSVAYASPSHEKLGNGIRINTISEDGLTEVIAYYSASSPFKLLLMMIAWYKTISIAVRLNGKPAIIHAHILTRTAIIAWLAAFRYNVTYIITEHWSRYYPENLNYKGFIRKLVTKFAIKKAGVTTVVSKRLYSAMKNNGLNFSQWILPNVVDVDMFSISESQRPVFTFVSITCFEEKSKNLKMLINAARIHKEAGFDFELLMIGDGADRKLIEQYATDSGVNATFTGTLSPSETAAMLKSSHCLLLSSNYETFGIVVYEALACGVPVIATKVADLDELIDTSSGIIIPVGSSNAMAAAMKEIQIRHDAFNKNILRQKVINTCSISSVSQVLNDLYQRFIK